MAEKPDVAAHLETFEHLKAVRAAAIEHFVIARRLHEERRDILRSLVEKGFSQADIARELGVTRQAIQKMMAGTA